MKKSPVEAAKDAAKTVDRKVSDTLVDGIEIGRMSALFRISTLLYPCLLYCTLVPCPTTMGGGWMMRKSASVLFE